MRRGSSPRGRGKRDRSHLPHTSAGLIPAWAGKTGLRQRRYLGCRAHPRVGGENMVTAYNTRTRVGSSPRGRGKPVAVDGELLGQRLIPAWAGKTSPDPPWPSRLGAHPRVGGENLPKDSTVREMRGSSPRGRGKPARFRWARLDRRLIPAWAGKTRERGTCP